MNWKTLHTNSHTNYRGLRTPRSDCPYCWEVYNSSKKNATKDKVEEEPEKQTQKVVIRKTRDKMPKVKKTVEDKPKVIGKIRRPRKSKEVEKPKIKFELDPDQLVRTRRNVALMGVSEENLDKIINTFGIEIYEYLSRFRRVYGGLSERCVGELIISVIDGLLKDELIIQDKK